MGKSNTMAWEDGVLGSIVVPDVLTPEQYYDARRGDSAIAPVKRLMMAVLADALNCFQKNSDAKNGPRQRLFFEAQQWIYGEQGDGPFSFATICETLGIEPGFLRSGLKEWRHQRSAGISPRRLARRSPVDRRGRVGTRSHRRKSVSQTMQKH
jgi:hypothetical protein